MLFGEIEEPSTRALIDEDLEDYPDITETKPVWEGTVEIPTSIDTLIFIETEKVRKLFHHCVLDDAKPVARIKNGGIDVFQTGNQQYLVVFSERKVLTLGEVTEAFEKWISTAKNIFTITSDSINNYHNTNLLERPESLIRMLSNDTKSFGYDKLETPNLVAGLGASVLSYCIHRGLKCTLFIAYIDASPLDSVNMGPLLALLGNIGVPIRHTDLNITESSNNLYM